MGYCTLPIATFLQEQFERLPDLCGFESRQGKGIILAGSSLTF